MKYCYVQSEGNVYLVERDGKLCLPRPEEVPFKVREVTSMKLGEHEVVWCDSHVHGGKGWMYRDDVLVSNANIDRLARLAAIKSYPRLTANVFLIKNGKVLMVKPSRGMAKRKWITPGGFVEYGESPEEAVRRETEEETGLKVSGLEILSIESVRYRSSNYHFVTVFFVGNISGEPIKNDSEIEEMKFMDVSEALKVTVETNHRAALEKLARRMGA